MSIGVFVLVADVVCLAVGGAIEAIVCATSDVDGIDEAILADGVGKVPHCLLALALYVEEFLAHACQGSALHLAVKIETAWQDSVGNEDELAEEVAPLFYAIVLDLLVARYANDDVVVCHGTITQTAVVGG